MPARSVIWLGSSRRNLKRLPPSVQDAMGFALWQAQSGGEHPNAKPLKGFGSAGVLEVVDDDDGDTYRTVYTLTLPDAVYVLHAFQKKSKRGDAVPQTDMDLIHQRLRQAEALHRRGAPRPRGERT